MTAVRKSVQARLHRRMLQGLYREGFLVTVTITARLQRNAKIAQGAFTAARRTLLMNEAVSFLVSAVQLGSPQIVAFSSFIIWSCG